MEDTIAVIGNPEFSRIGVEGVLTAGEPIADGGAGREGLVRDPVLRRPLLEGADHRQAGPVEGAVVRVET
ncbi:hypothetical protein KC221_29010, partial [Mycobacterium tuberculosis]|nr:hypothetical protein [Mycobacterium tuberculosis]